jgi:FkbH-like protein
LVLDLDNTLWGGILGEDGIEGIQMSGDYPGKAYHLWQEGLLELKNQGVILAICSKNNENDVLEVWKNRTDIVLKKDDFVTYRINWLDKATNIKSIANELNIGLDSFVFIDDNPTERELIKQQLPDVVVPEWVSQPYELPVLLKNIVENYFTVYTITDEDRQKTNQYKLKAEREELQSQFSNLDDFIRSLNIELSIEPINDVTIVRAAQMTQKTNQFNLTTRRYTESDIRLILSDGGLGWTLSVKDKFGDN